VNGGYSNLKVKVYSEIKEILNAEGNGKRNHYHTK
jgi:hypothetical protein